MSNRSHSSPQASAPKEKWLLLASIAVVLAYAWLSAWSLEPRIQISNEVATDVVWLKSGKPVDEHLVAAQNPTEMMRFEREMLAAQFAARIFPRAKRPPILLVHLDRPDVYVVGDSRVELGFKYFSTPGLVVKALIKSWLYRANIPTVTTSLLRLEVVSDFLTAVVRGEAQIGNFRTSESQPLPELGPWINFAASYSSAWTVAELADVKGESLKINSFAFRPLFVAALWATYQEVPLFERVDFIKSWLGSLKAMSWEEALVLGPQSDSLSEWKQWLANEWKVFSLCLEKTHSMSPLVLNEVSSRMGLDTGANIKIADIVIDQGELNWRTARDQWSDLQKTWVYVDSKRQAWLLAYEPSTGLRGLVTLESGDVEKLQAHQIVWRACESPKINEVLTAAAGAEQILYVQACADSSRVESLKDYLRNGLQEFARQDREDLFLHIKKASIELAVHRGYLQGEARLTSVFELMDEQTVRRPHSLHASPGTSPGTSSVLGLDRAQWSTEHQAYQVLGAIEAIDWIRPRARPLSI